jgi:hypothetical protein
LKWALRAFQSVYGYEFQGDSLLVARINLLLTYVDYLQDRWERKPTDRELREIAKVISWNLWQMDGLKCVIPNSCRNGIRKETDLFGNVKEIEEMCPGCKKKLGNVLGHNGIYCTIADWKDIDDPSGENTEKVRFVDLMKKS